MNKNQQSIPIFLASDDNYAPFLCTTMYSILQNTKAQISFYVLDGGITDKSKKLISKSLFKFDNYQILYTDMTTFGLERFPDVAHYSINAFSRYFIPEIAPDLEKALYIDVDVIVKGDIVELYNQDLENYDIAAVLEDFYAGNYTNLKEKIYPKYNGGDKYFNSGVLLFNVQNFIKKKYPEKFVKLTIDLYDKLCCPDQDVFNIVFENNFKILDYKYNFMPDHLEMLKTKHPEIQNIEPLIIHYTSQKPWKAKSARSADFDEVLKKTKFYEIVKEKYKTLKIKTYYLFGFIPLLKMDIK